MILHTSSSVQDATSTAVKSLALKVIPLENVNVAVKHHRAITKTTESYRSELKGLSQNETASSHIRRAQRAAEKTAQKGGAKSA